MEKKNHAVAYVDGSYSNNTAGYGVVFFYEDAKEPEYFSGRCKNASMNNVSGEIEASLFAVNKALEYGCSSIDICYDYTGIEYWATGVWRAKKKETMAYRDQMNFFKGMIDIQFHHVEAHTGDRWNEKADDLAINAVLGKKEEKIQEVDTYDAKDRGIKPECSAAIRRFYQKKDHKFKDFMQLKVGGIDRFSRLKEEDLEDMILSEMKETIEKGIHDPSSYNNVLKWMLRGLSLDDAIHKVNVDYEIASNCIYY